MQHLYELLSGQKAEAWNYVASRVCLGVSRGRVVLLCVFCSVLK